jgi:hypothetical protein
MSIFEYVMVLLSVVLSLSLTQLLTTIGLLLRAGRRVRWSVTYAMWLVLTLALVFDMWTSLWLLHERQSWSLGILVFVLLQCASIYLFAYLMTPEDKGPGESGGGTIDLWDYHVRNRRLYLAPVIAYDFAGMVMNLLVLPKSVLVDLSTWVFVVPVTILLMLAWWLPHAWVQRIATAAMLGTMLVYFTFFFSSIG